MTSGELAGAMGLTQKAVQALVRSLKLYGHVYECTFRNRVPVYAAVIKTGGTILPFTRHTLLDDTPQAEKATQIVVFRDYLVAALFGQAKPMQQVPV
jgi:hypothetical protein